jgi:hypothetical protein
MAKSKEPGEKKKGTVTKKLKLGGTYMLPEKTKTPLTCNGVMLEIHIIIAQ